MRSIWNFVWDVLLCLLCGAFAVTTMIVVALFAYVLISESVKGTVSPMWPIIFIGGQAIVGWIAYHEMKEGSP